MANGNKQDVTLVIKAQNEAKAEFQKLVDIVKKVSTGFDGAQDSAASLSAELTKLNSGKAAAFYADVLKAATQTREQYVKTKADLDALIQRQTSLRTSITVLTKEQQTEANNFAKLAQAKGRELDNISSKLSKQIALLREVKAATGSSTPAQFAARVSQANTAVADAAAADRMAAANARVLEGQRARLDSLKAELVARKALNQTPIITPRIPATTPGSGLGGLFGKFDPSGPRQTLDYYQRLRGQLLAMTSGYIGLYQVVGQFNKALTEQQQIQSARARIGVSLGTSDTGAINAEMARLKETAKSLGLEFLPLTAAFSKFSVSAKLSGATSLQVNAVFTNMAKAAATLGLSTEELQGTFLGLEQIFNKGKLTAEDFRGQVAERLPGAMAVLAKSLGVTTAELNKMFQAGEIGSEALVGFAVQYGKYLETVDIPLTQRLAAQLNNLQNAAVDLRSDFMEGAAPGLMEAITLLRKQMEDPAFRESVKEFGKNMGQIAIALAKIAPYIPDIIKFVGVLIGLKALRGGTAALVETVMSWQRLTTVLRGTVVAVTAQEVAMLSLSTTLTKIMPTIIMASRWIGVAGLAASFAYLSVKIKDTNDEINKTEGKMSTLAKLIRIAQETTGLGSRKPAEEAERQAEAERKIRDEKRAKEQAALEEQRQAQLQASQTLVDQTSAAFDAQLANLDAQIDTIEKINKGLAEQKKLATDSANAAVNAVKKQASVEGGGSGVIMQEQLDKIKDIEQRLQDQLAQLDEAAAKKRQDIFDKANNERVASAQRAADLIRQAETLALKDKDQTVSEKAQVEHLRFVSMQQEVLLSKDLTQEEKDRLKVMLQQAEVERISILNREDLVKQAKEQEERAEKLVQIRDTRITAIEAQGEAAGLPKAEVLKQVQEEYASTEVAILSAMEAARNYWEAVGGEDSVLKLAQLDAGIAKIKGQGKAMSDVSVKVAALQENLADGLTGAITDFAKGTKSASDALKDFATEFLSFIVQAIIKAQILKAIQSTSGDGGVFGSLAGLMHSGGVVGSANRSMSVNASAFMSAPRYHNGGIAGMQPNEVPTVLQKGEEVLTRNDPRHILNGGRGSQSAQMQPQDIKVINTIDSASVVKEGFASPGTEKIIMNIVKANKNAFNQILGNR